MSNFLQKLQKLDVLLGTRLRDEANAWSNELWNEWWCSELDDLGQCQQCCLTIASGWNYCLPCEEWSSAVQLRPQIPDSPKWGFHGCTWCNYRISLNKSYCPECETWFETSRPSFYAPSSCNYKVYHLLNKSSSSNTTPKPVKVDDNFTELRERDRRLFGNYY